MPRQSEAKKDVLTCEKLWGAGKELRAIGIRMGEPNTAMYYLIKSKVLIRGEPGEVKHLSNPRKRNQTRLRE